MHFYKNSTLFLFSCLSRKKELSLFSMCKVVIKSSVAYMESLRNYMIIL